MSHRGTALVTPLGARYTIRVNFRTVDADWIARCAWTDSADRSWWHVFVRAPDAEERPCRGRSP